MNSVKVSLLVFSFSNEPSIYACAPLKYVLYLALKECHQRVCAVFFFVEHATMMIVNADKHSSGKYFFEDDFTFI